MANFEHAEGGPKHVKMSGELPAAGSPAKPDGGPDAPGGALSTIPSFSAAAALLSAPYSCLVLNTHRRHIALPPVYLNKKKTGIKEELDAELLKFSQSLHGVPLAYDNIMITSNRGDIYDDSGYIHMDIEASFIVFQPRKGQKLLGKVNKLGVGHVGCLVHGCFNASIPKPGLVSVETWRDAGPRIGTELEFKVSTLDADAAGVLLIRGQLDKTRVQELMAQSEGPDSSVPADQNESPEADTGPEPAEVDTPKKKKKKKKIKDEETSSEAPELNGMMEETNGADSGAKKKKKKKKDKHDRGVDVKEEEEETLVCDMNNHVSRKRKHENGTDTLSELKPKKSKKKKGDIDLA